MSNQNSKNLLDRFPPLQRLGSRFRTRRIKVVQQLTATECGAACLAMVLGYFGKRITIDQIRETTSIDRDGLSALSILEAGRQHGLRGRGLRVDIDDIDYLKPATILHWEFNHFVIFSGKRGNGFDIVDPAAGRRFIPMKQFARSFTGVALEFEPGESFEQISDSENRLGDFVKKLICTSGLISR